MKSNRLLAPLVLSLAAGCGGAQQTDAETPPPAGAQAEKAPRPGGSEPARGDVRTSDVDEDGQPEVTKYYEKIDDPERKGQRKSVLVRQELDLTWDGRPDIWRYFAPDGKVTKEEWDLDYDGNVDETRYFESGVIVRSERDHDNDGRIDVVRYYSDGKLERKETDSNGDGNADRWEYFEGQVLDRIGVDKDHDGTVDTWAKAATQRS
ncbi:MAG: hypothetical protein ACFB9M_11500 [Myxococcota bacterium]